MMKNIAVTTIIGIVLASAVPVMAQQITAVKFDELIKRVEALEDYSDQLQASLNEFSKDLVSNLDQQLQSVRSSAIVVNPLSRKVSKIETNTGAFLLAVSRMDKIEGGYRLYLQIGNPNAATYGDVKLRLFWGIPFNVGTIKVTYDQWRQTLKGAEFSYPGALEAGAWTDIAVDLKPAEYNQLQHIECEMEVNTVKLQRSRPSEADSQR